MKNNTYRVYCQGKTSVVIPDRVKLLINLTYDKSGVAWRPVVDLPRLMVCFNHSTQRQTLDYLCIQLEVIKDIYENELWRYEIEQKMEVWNPALIPDIIIILIAGQQWNVACSWSHFILPIQLIKKDFGWNHLETKPPEPRRRDRYRTTAFSDFIET